MPVGDEDVSKYGIFATAERINDRLVRSPHVIEKPKPGEAPSNLAGVSGFVLTPDVFDYLEETSAGQGGEIWLMDAVQKIAQKGNLYALEFEGKRYDAGSKPDYLQATVDIALGRPDLGPALREYLKGLNL
jgi:UTP--glucose-1-phosphate uridylyltransferase